MWALSSLSHRMLWWLKRPFSLSWYVYLILALGSPRPSWRVPGQLRLHRDHHLQKDHSLGGREHSVGSGNGCFKGPTFHFSPERTSHNHLTPVSGDLKPSSGPCRHQTHTWFTDIHAGKAPIYIKWNIKNNIPCIKSTYTKVRWSLAVATSSPHLWLWKLTLGLRGRVKRNQAKPKQAKAKDLKQKVQLSMFLGHSKAGRRGKRMGRILLALSDRTLDTQIWISDEQWVSSISQIVHQTLFY